MSQTKFMQEIFVGIVYLFIVLPFLVALCVLVIYWVVKAQEYERDYISELPKKQKRIVLQYKHSSRMPLKYLFIKKGNKENENK